MGKACVRSPLGSSPPVMALDVGSGRWEVKLVRSVNPKYTCMVYGFQAYPMAPSLFEAKST